MSPIKPTLLLLLMVFYPILANAQQAEPIRSITRIEKSPDYYKTQANSWEKWLQKKPKDANAWYQYYTAARYTNMFFPNAPKPYDLSQIVADMKQQIPNTFEYYYLQYSLDAWSDKGFSFLEKACELAPQRYETFSAMITQSELKRNHQKTREFCQKWYHSSDHSPGLMSWNYNMLVNLEANALLFTQGDNDTYPSWVLQQVKNFRTDVLVLNTSLLLVAEYRDLLCRELEIPLLKKTKVETRNALEQQQAIIEHFIQHSQRPAYLAISIHPDLRSKMENHLYLTGMTFRYSKATFDNIPVLRKYYEQQMLTDAFSISLLPDPAEGVLPKSNLNYLPVLIKLLQYYQEEGDKSRELRLKEQIRQIATAANQLEKVDKYLQH